MIGRPDVISQYEVPVGISRIIRTADGQIKDIKVESISGYSGITKKDIDRIIALIPESEDYSWNVKAGEVTTRILSNELLTLIAGDNISLTLSDHSLTITGKAGVVTPVSTFMGIADTSTDPGTPTADQWWSAQEVGIYVNFGNVEVTTITGVYNWLVWNNSTSAWSIQQVPVNYTSFIPTVTDGILDFGVDNNLRIGASPYSAKKGSDPGFAYLYTGTANPTFTNRLNLDGSLHLTRLSVYSPTDIVSLSAELNTNPSGWTCGTNWTNNGNNTYTATAGSGLLSTTITATIGRRYLITWTGSSGLYITGLTVSVGTATFIPGTGSIYTVADITAVANGSLTVSFQFSSISAGTISNISIKELTPITSRISPGITYNSNSTVTCELRSNPTLYNTALGLNSQGYMYIGQFNTSLGNRSLENLTVGYQNVAIGYESLYALTAGSYNTVIGYSAAMSLTTGCDNVAIGSSALILATSAYRNVAVGRYALSHLTTSYANIAVGYAAAYTLTTGTCNVAVGDNALYQNSVGIHNTAIGYQTLYTSTGIMNTAIGSSAALNLTTGNFNTSIGYSSATGLTTGGYNTFICNYNDVNQVGGVRLYQTLGFSSDSHVILLGYGATKQKLVSTLTNSIGIGNYVRIYQDNQVVLGNTDITSTYLRGNVEIRNHQVLASNSLSEGTFVTHAKWTESGDITYNINKFTYTNSTGSGTLEQAVANFAIAIKPYTWYKISYQISNVVNPTGGSFAGTITSDLNGTQITMYAYAGLSYIYLKSGASPNPFGKYKLSITSTGTGGSFDIVNAGIEEITGGDLYINRDIEQRRGCYQYHRQYFGVDTAGDWRSYGDDAGFYVQYYDGATWTTKHTITP